MAGYTTELANLVLSFLTLYKGNGNRLNRGGHNSNSYSRLREDAFLKVLQPVMDEYERQNAAVGEIDYEDMIQCAKYVQENRFDMPYKYILVDEFQDISNGRAELLSALHRSSENVALFCVGDDWQSIYRFAGSDIGAMTRFQNYFGYSGIVKLDVTFRFDSRLADTSSRFVLKNPIQMQKVISSNRSGAESSVILYSLDKIEPRWDWCLKRIEALTREQSTVLILERYKKNLPYSGDPITAN
ncbi:MAG: UvrD-helicase domain-containing protein [Ignavibacteria bacterium]|nr:UvrD-helicase domain-containing protein [Ignavibacteria bacterium]